MIYNFQCKVWKWNVGKASWFFVSVPVEKTKHIKQNNASKGTEWCVCWPKLGKRSGKRRFFMIQKGSAFFCR